MLAMSVRDSPCRARFWRSSLGRCTRRVPSSSRSTVMGAATVWRSVPLGPVTLTVWPSMATSTPLGTAIGSRPIRDISFAPLPDVGEDFPTHALLVRLLVGQQPGRGRDDRHAETPEHLGQGGGLGVDPQTGLGHPPDTGDAALTVGAVLQVDHQLLEGGAVLLDVVDGPAGDVALLLEDLGDLRLQLRRRHDRRVVIRLVGVAQTRQHVRDRVGHRHGVCCLSRRGSSCAGSRRLGAGPLGDQWVVWLRCREPRRAERVVGGSGVLLLPGTLAHARELPGVGHLPQADPAEAELAEDRVRTAAPLAAGVAADRELRLAGRLVDQSLLGHGVVSYRLSGWWSRRAGRRRGSRAGAAARGPRRRSWRW